MEKYTYADSTMPPILKENGKYYRRVEIKKFGCAGCVFESIKIDDEYLCTYLAAKQYLIAAPECYGDTGYIEDTTITEEEYIAALVSSRLST